MDLKGERGGFWGTMWRDTLLVEERKTLGIPFSTFNRSPIVSGTGAACPDDTDSSKRE